MSERIQTVVFVRHGVAQHNFRGADLTSPSLWDPSLVIQGKVGAIEAGQKIQMWLQAKNKSIQLVMASPLTRCLQTAVLGFLPGEQYEKRSHAIPIVCVEQVREAFGLHYPDKRRTKSTLQNHWPMIQFDRNMTEEDALWSHDARESLDSLETRIEQFLQLLSLRSEENIVVVTHGVWMETLFRKYAPSVLEGERRVYNCNAFASECISSSGRFQRIQNTHLI